MRFLSDDLLFWGRTMGVTGSGPYDEMAIERIVALEGALVGDYDIWQTNQMVIVGREAFDKDYLLRSVEFGLEEGFTCRYFSQEDFWDYWLGGDETAYYAGDPRIASHEGLSFIASIGFKWPSIEFVQGHGGKGSLADRLNPAHQLKSRFGYSVKAGVPAKERRQRLGRAVNGSGALGLRAVAEHLAFLISLNLRRYDDRMLDPIERWESDLDWLYRSYYEGKAYSFVWPETD